MSQVLTKRSVAVAVTCLLITTGLAHAASIDCSGTKRSKEAVSTETIRPGDRPDHTLKLVVRTHVISSQDADFDGSEQAVYGLEDSVARGGTVVGYFLYTLKSGDKVWARFDSVYDMTPKPGESWESHYQGVFTFVRGTGKFVNIRGHGQYRGTVTPKEGFRETFHCSAEY